MSTQLDMFDPLHVMLKHEAEHQYKLAEPYLAKAKELTEQYKAACPHDVVDVKTEWHEDEYGRATSYADLYIQCRFCGTRRIVDKDKMVKSEYTLQQVLKGAIFVE
jgi:NADH pyrophosphatase NudC (nudix superfamily)